MRLSFCVMCVLDLLLVSRAGALSPITVADHPRELGLVGSSVLETILCAVKENSGSHRTRVSALSGHGHGASASISCGCGRIPGARGPTLTAHSITARATQNAVKQIMSLQLLDYFVFSGLHAPTQGNTAMS